MGDSQSKTQSADDFFLLQHLSKMQLKNRKIVSYYLISSHNTHATQTLQEYFKIDTFPSVNTLKQQMSFVGKDQVVKVIVTDSVPQQDIDYLQQQPKIKQIIGFNSSAKGGKVAGNAKSTQDLINVLNSLEDKDQLDIPTNNVLFTIDQDTKKLNLYRLNYHCNTLYNDRSKAKEDFVKLARKLYPQQSSQIDKFQKDYDLDLKGEDRRKMVLDWVFKNNFYWDLVNQLSRNTNDPKRLAYIRLPIKDIYQTILNDYKKNKPNQQFYIIAEITQEQKQKLFKSQKNFLLFTSFIKGFINEKQARAKYKQLKKASDKYFIFTCSIDHRDRHQNLDFGFVIHKNQVLVNIYNVFLVQNASKTLSGQLVYGVLPQYNVKRQDPEFRLGMGKTQLDLTRNYDFLEDIMNKIDGQATLLQINGYYKESLDIYDKKVDFIRKTNESQQVMNRTLIKKADALALTGDHKGAERAFSEVNTSSKKIKVICLIHQADMYMRLCEEQKLIKLINQIEPLLSVLEDDQKEKQQLYKARHLIAIKKLKNGELKKAHTLLSNLITNVSSTYSFKMQGKPLYHDIYRSLAACEFKQGNHNDALMKLNQTLSLQLACQGKTHNVAMTQTLIQTVCRTSGNKQQLQKSQERLKEMSTDIGTNQTRLSPASVTNLNSSMISINM